MSALKVMIMAGAIAVATCLTAYAAPLTGTPAHTSLDTMKKGKKMKMKKDTTSKM